MVQYATSGRRFDDLDMARASFSAYSQTGLYRAVHRGHMAAAGNLSLIHISIFQQSDTDDKYQEHPRKEPEAYPPPDFPFGLSF